MTGWQRRGRSPPHHPNHGTVYAYTREFQRKCWWISMNIWARRESIISKINWHFHYPEGGGVRHSNYFILPWLVSPGGIVCRWTLTCQTSHTPNLCFYQHPGGPNLCYWALYMGLFAEKSNGQLRPCRAGGCTILGVCWIICAFSVEKYAPCLLKNMQLCLLKNMRHVS